MQQEWPYQWDPRSPQTVARPSLPTLLPGTQALIHLTELHFPGIPNPCSWPQIYTQCYTRGKMVLKVPNSLGCCED